MEAGLCLSSPPPLKNQISGLLHCQAHTKTVFAADSMQKIPHQKPCILIWYMQSGKKSVTQKSSENGVVLKDIKMSKWMRPNWIIGPGWMLRWIEKQKMSGKEGGNPKTRMTQLSKSHQKDSLYGWYGDYNFSNLGRHNHTTKIFKDVLETRWQLGRIFWYDRMGSLWWLCTSAITYSMSSCNQIGNQLAPSDKKFAPLGILGNGFMSMLWSLSRNNQASSPMWWSWNDSSLNLGKCKFRACHVQDQSLASDYSLVS